MAETTSRGIQATLFDYFQDIEYFDLQEANELLLKHQNRDINAESIRARIYEGIDKGLFERVGKGLYTVTRKDEQGRENTCLLINGDGRDLSMFADNSIDALITDHPYDTKKSLKGGNRDFADYELFQYNEKDFAEKQRVLKPGHFLVEFLPEENGDNYEYLFKVKELARKSGLEYYAKVPWKKGDFVANTGRKSKNTEDICFFTKGKARDLRPDAKKDKAEPGVAHFMSGAHGMLPTVFDVGINKRDKIHQAEKPVELLKQILSFITKEDELVLDQFAGSGSLGVAASESNRNSILIEKDEETFEKMSQRIFALQNAQVFTNEHREAINVAIDALEAVQDGDEHIKHFTDYQNKQNMKLSDAHYVLNEIWMSSDDENIKEAINSASKAIEIADPSIKQENNISRPKILECSIRGDKRFCALFAKITIKGKEKSIEEWYQEAKRTADGKKAGKGKAFDHIVCPFTGDKLPAVDAEDLYRGLWITYLSKKPELVEYASQFDEFSDMSQSEPNNLDFIEAINGLQPDPAISSADVIESYVKGDRERYVSAVKSSNWYKNILEHKPKKPFTQQISEAQNRAEEQTGEQMSLFSKRNSFQRDN